MVFAVSTLSLLAAATPSVSRTQHSEVVSGSAQPYLLQVPTSVISPTAPAAGPLSLSIHTAPATICAFGGSNCAAGVGQSRVTMTAIAQPGVTDWPVIQVLFVIDGTFYNGGFRNLDDHGFDVCDVTGSQPTCEESNGIPFFVAHATQLAGAIAAAHPHSQISFGLAHYPATGCDYGDCDGEYYAVDFGNFVPASEFQTMVTSTFQAIYLLGGYACADCDFWDNFLHGSSVTELYGALVGQGIAWSSYAHHVIVWVGDTAPRAQGYEQNYCVSGWDGGMAATCYSPSCEPGYAFISGAMPECEGWASSQDGNPADSIAALAHHSPACVHSLGGSCTIDIIDLVSTATDPYSIGWPTTDHYGVPGGPGSPLVLQNVNRVIRAGCDLAAATGGTWDGPSYAVCANGVSGDLRYEVHGPIDTPNIANPSLLQAFRHVGVGSPGPTVVAGGAGGPLFQFVPFGSIVVAHNAQATAACYREGLPFAECQTTPRVFQLGSERYLGWNWSYDPAANGMLPGDVWTAQFNVVATGPPFGVPVPVDSCATVACRAAGSTPVNGLYTWAHAATGFNVSNVTESFPLARVTVELNLSSGLAPPGPPPPAPPPGIPIVVPAPVQIPAPLAVPVTTTIGSLSLNATAAGILTAALSRITVKNRPIALGLGMKAGPLAKPGGHVGADKPYEIGHFE